MKRERGLLRLIILIFALFLFYSHAFAYETCKTSGGVDIQWSTPNATYFINTAGGPSDSIPAIQAGMQAWTDVVSSEFIFYYGGTTNKKAHGRNDGTNIVTFGSLAVGTVAVNSYWYYTGSGNLIDSDIRFNKNYPWSTTGSPGAFDVQNVGTHEHGHSLCLKDLYTSADTEKTMYGIVGYGETKKRTLHQDDIDGITYLYPAPCLDPVRVLGTPPVYYSNLQSAYDAAWDGDTIQSHDQAFNEDLYIDDNKSVTLEGGYDCYYSTITGKTTLNGNLTISNGTVTIGNFELQ